MKPTYCPGGGFPFRLQSLLFRLHKRPADVERDTGGKVKADTVSGWLKARHFPERYAFCAFLRHYAITSEEARELLYGPKGGRDQRRLQRKDRDERLIGSLWTLLDRVEASLNILSEDEVALISARLQVTHKRLQERRPSPSEKKSNQVVGR